MLRRRAQGEDAVSVAELLERAVGRTDDERGPTRTMLRERSGGLRGAVLHAEMNIGIGTTPMEPA